VKANNEDWQTAQMANDPNSGTKGKFFTATLNLPVGNNTVSIVASDLNSPPKQTTQNYSLTVAGGVGKTYSYDLNGNMTMNGSQTYEWDAEDRLMKITQLSTNWSTS
jgi:hypothetical protein